MLQNSAMFQSMATVCGWFFLFETLPSCNRIEWLSNPLPVNLISISYGATAGWPSSAALLLKSDQLTPLSCGALSNDQLSWIGSLMGIGGLIGSILFGWLADRAGRKLTLCLIALPAIVGEHNTNTIAFVGFRLTVKVCKFGGLILCLWLVRAFRRSAAGSWSSWPPELSICTYRACWVASRRAARSCWCRCLWPKSPKIGESLNALTPRRGSRCGGGQFIGSTLARARARIWCVCVVFAETWTWPQSDKNATLFWFYEAHCSYRCTHAQPPGGEWKITCR